MNIIFFIAGGIVGVILGMFFMSCFFLPQKREYENCIKKLSDENKELKSVSARKIGNSSSEICSLRDER